MDSKTNFTGGGCRPALACSLSEYSEEMPTREGLYLMTCMENDHEPESVNVFRSGKRVMAALDSLGVYDLHSIHEGLTDLKWKHALSIKENA